MEGKTNRLLALEGLRGVAAVMVVIFHALLIFYPAFFYGPEFYVGGVHPIHFEDNTYGNPLTVFLSGPFAVALFFVISGFVLTIGFFQTGNQDIIRKLAAKRYIRLMLPALASILLVWLVLSFGLNSFKDATQPITQSGWLQPIWDVTPGFFDAVNQGVWGIFSAGEVAYNPVLWTMKYEMLGSILVFAVVLLFGHVKQRWVIYALLLFATYNNWYLGFVIGMILADLYAKGFFPFAKVRKIGLYVGALVVGLFLAGYPSPSPLSSVKDTIYWSLNISWMTQAQIQSLYLTVGAAMVLIAILMIPRVRMLFEWKYISVLGRYTYSLYLTHMAVLFVFCTALFLWLNPIVGYNVAALLSIVVSIIPLALVAFWFEKYIDGPSIRLSGVFSNWLLGFPQKVGPEAFTEVSSPRRPWAIMKKLKLPGLGKRK
jgi:peptidoglycan/LPS O-acetylase OafA/YrhL